MFKYSVEILEKYRNFPCKSIKQGGLMMTPRILVVEDEKEIAKILKIELEYEGYEVLLADDGKLGLQLGFNRTIRFNLIRCYVTRDQWS